MSENQVMTTEEIHARCAALGIDPGKKGDKALSELISVVEVAIANSQPVKEKPLKPQHINERKAQTQAAARYRKEKLVEVTVSPMYSDEFGNVMPVSLQGVRIYMPCDGSVQKVPKSFAAEIRRRIYAVDIKTKRRKRMANVKANSEKSPGAIRLFR